MSVPRELITVIKTPTAKIPMVDSSVTANLVIKVME